MLPRAPYTIIRTGWKSQKCAIERFLHIKPLSCPNNAVLGVWLGIMPVKIICVGTVFYSNDALTKSQGHVCPTRYHQLFNLFLLSGEYLPNKKLSVRLLTGIWCLMAVVLINSYTGNLTSYLSVPKLNPIPNSFAELAASNEFKLSIQANSVLMKSIMVKNNVCIEPKLTLEYLN